MATYSNLPTAYSNKGKVERLRSDAAASLHRMSLRMVPGAGANFSIYSALRTTAEQHALFVANYRNTGKTYANGDRPRKYKGTWWARKPGSVAVAVPGTPRANHEGGLAIDIHPGAVQEWLKANGRRFGWDWAEGKRNGENWHFRYYPSLDRYKSEGTPKIAAMQKALGVTSDGKIGTGTVAAIKKFQKANGLTVDGIAGPDTQARILGGGGKAPSVPGGGTSVPAPKPSPGVVEGTIIEPGKLPKVDRSKSSPNTHKGRVDPKNGKTYSVKHVTAHWWGQPSGQSHDGIVRHLCDPKSEVSAHYVISPGRVSQIIDEDDSSWANGNRVANFESITIECDPNDILGTLPVLAALIADIWSRHAGFPVYPHQHWVGTECPGDYLPLLPDVEELAAGKTVSVTLTGSAGKPGTVGEDGRLGRETAAELQGRLGVTADGMIGPDTLVALAKYLGAPHADGKISRQPQGALDLGNGYRKDLVEVGDGDSPLVRLWQAYVGAKVDGRLGAETVSKTQAALNASPDAFTAADASTVAKRTKGVLDKAPAKPKKVVDEDGRFGKKTSAEIQRRIGSKADGRICEDGWKKLARKYGTKADGVVSHQSYKAAELGNGLVPRCWKYTGRKSKGSPLIRAIQKDVGVKADGIAGEGTTRAIQKRLNSDPDWLR